MPTTGLTRMSTTAPTSPSRPPRRSPGTVRAPGSARRRIGLLLAALLLPLLPAALVTGAAAPAHADGCYTWNRTLQQGASGGDVTELQIRVAGWAGYDRSFAVDGQYGPGTVQAVRDFQSAYGLGVDGVAGAQTFAKLYDLQDDDCTPVHFSWDEVDDVCFGGFPAPVSGTVAQVRANLIQVMWRAEALRHRLGDHPLRVTSAYRGKACNDQVGGSATSNHMYGRGIDLVPAGGGVTLCKIAQEARYVAFRELLGPGYPDHSDHIHLGIQSGKFWRASQCGI